MRVMISRNRLCLLNFNTPARLLLSRANRKKMEPGPTPTQQCRRGPSDGGPGERAAPIPANRQCTSWRAATRAPRPMAAGGDGGPDREYAVRATEPAGQPSRRPAPDQRGGHAVGEHGVAAARATRPSAPTPRRSGGGRPADRLGRDATPGSSGCAPGPTRNAVAPPEVYKASRGHC